MVLSHVTRVRIPYPLPSWTIFPIFAIIFPMSFAVIKTGGKQYKVAQGDTLLIEKLEADKGAEVVFDQVLLAGEKIGTPLVDGATVKATVLEQGKGKKKIVFKYASKTRYKKKKGHRQPFTKVQIVQISA